MAEKKNFYSLGIDIGSTTVKIAILNPDGIVVFSDYTRHFADIQGTLAGLLEKAKEQLGEVTLHPVITGSGGLVFNRKQLRDERDLIYVDSLRFEKAD